MSMVLFCIFIGGFEEVVKLISNRGTVESKEIKLVDELVYLLCEMMLI